MEMYVIKDTLVIGVGDTTFSERYDYKIKYDEDGNIVYRTWIDTVVVFEKDSMPKYKNEDSIRFVDISSKTWDNISYILGRGAMAWILKNQRQ